MRADTMGSHLPIAAKSMNSDLITFSYTQKSETLGPTQRLEVEIDKQGNITVQTFVQSIFQQLVNKVISTLTFGKYKEVWVDKSSEKYLAIESVRKLCQKNEAFHSLQEVEAEMVEKIICELPTFDDIRLALKVKMATLEANLPIWDIEDEVIPTGKLTAEQLEVGQTTLTKLLELIPYTFPQQHAELMPKIKAELSRLIETYKEESEEEFPPKCRENRLEEAIVNLQEAFDKLPKLYDKPIEIDDLSPKELQEIYQKLLNTDKKGWSPQQIADFDNFVIAYGVAAALARETSSEVTLKEYIFQDLLIDVADLDPKSHSHTDQQIISIYQKIIAKFEPLKIDDSTPIGEICDILATSWVEQFKKAEGCIQALIKLSPVLSAYNNLVATAEAELKSSHPTLYLNEEMIQAAKEALELEDIEEVADILKHHHELVHSPLPNKLEMALVRHKQINKQKKHVHASIDAFSTTHVLPLKKQLQELQKTLPQATQEKVSSCLEAIETRFQKLKVEYTTQTRISSTQHLLSALKLEDMPQYSKAANEQLKQEYANLTRLLEYLPQDSSEYQAFAQLLLINPKKEIEKYSNTLKEYISLNLYEDATLNYTKEWTDHLKQECAKRIDVATSYLAQYKNKPLHSLSPKELQEYRKTVSTLTDNGRKEMLALAPFPKVDQAAADYANILKDLKQKEEFYKKIGRYDFSTDVYMAIAKEEMLYQSAANKVANTKDMQKFCNTAKKACERLKQFEKDLNTAIQKDQDYDPPSLLEQISYIREVFGKSYQDIPAYQQLRSRPLESLKQAQNAIEINLNFLKKKINNPSSEIQNHLEEVNKIKAQMLALEQSFSQIQTDEQWEIFYNQSQALLKQANAHFHAIQEL